MYYVVFFSSRRRHTRCALVTGVQTCALPISVTKLGGTPVEPAAEYSFPVDQLKSERDVIAFAAGLEQGATSAYLGAVPLFGDRELAKAAASKIGRASCRERVCQYV